MILNTFIWGIEIIALSYLYHRNIQKTGRRDRKENRFWKTKKAKSTIFKCSRNKNVTSRSTGVTYSWESFLKVDRKNIYEWILHAIKYTFETLMETSDCCKLRMVFAFEIFFINLVSFLHWETNSTATEEDVRSFLHLSSSTSIHETQRELFKFTISLIEKRRQRWLQARRKYYNQIYLSFLGKFRDNTL